MDLEKKCRQRYYFYCWLAGHLFLGLYLTAVLTFGAAARDRSLIITLVTLILLAVTFAPYFRFPGFAQGPGTGIAPMLISFTAATIGITAGSVTLMETYFRVFLWAVPDPYADLLVGPVLVIAILVPLVRLDARLKHNFTVLQIKPNRPR